MSRERVEICECCGNRVTTYRRTLGASACLALAYICRHSRGHQWVEINRHAPAAVLRGRDWSRLVVWKLVEQHPEKRVYRPLEHGWRFLGGEVTVPQQAMIRKGEAQGFCGDWVTFRDIVGNTFDYEELMRWGYAMTGPKPDGYDSPQFGLPLA